MCWEALAVNPPGFLEAGGPAGGAAGSFAVPLPTVGRFSLRCRNMVVGPEAQSPVLVSADLQRPLRKCLHLVEFRFLPRVMGAQYISLACLAEANRLRGATTAVSVKGVLGACPANKARHFSFKRSVERKELLLSKFGEQNDGAQRAQ